MSDKHYSHGITFYSFSYLWSTAVQKYEMKKSRNKKFVSFKSPAILSSMMKSHTIQLHPTQSMNHPSVQYIPAEYATCLIVVV